MRYIKTFKFFEVNTEVFYRKQSIRDDIMDIFIDCECKVFVLSTQKRSAGYDGFFVKILNRSDNYDLEKIGLVSDELIESIERTIYMMYELGYKCKLEYTDFSYIGRPLDDISDLSLLKKLKIVQVSLYFNLEGFKGLYKK